MSTLGPIFPWLGIGDTLPAIALSSVETDQRPERLSIAEPHLVRGRGIGLVARRYGRKRGRGR